MIPTCEPLSLTGSSLVGSLEGLRRVGQKGRLGYNPYASRMPLMRAIIGINPFEDDLPLDTEHRTTFASTRDRYLHGFLSFVIRSATRKTETASWVLICEGFRKGQTFSTSQGASKATWSVNRFSRPDARTRFQSISTCAKASAKSSVHCTGFCEGAGHSHMLSLACASTSNSCQWGQTLRKANDF